MFRGIFVFLLALLAAQPAQAVQFVVQGTATGTLYQAYAGAGCEQPRCQGQSPYSENFYWVLNDSNGPPTGQLFSEYEPGRFNFTVLMGKATSIGGTFVKGLNGYIGTSYQASSYDINCPPGMICGTSVSTNSFQVTRIGGQPDPTPSAVPEPTTWAMLFAGLATVGGALRLRRKRASLALA